MLYIYDPINNTKRITTWDLLSGITGKKINNLMSYKCKNMKVANINCYIIDDETPKKQLKEFVQKEKINGEIWKQIKDTDYYISTHGRVKRAYKTKEKILMPFIKKNKWLHVKINGKEKVIHRLVAEYFVLNPNNCPCVVHKNGNKLDNFAGNLEWVERNKLGKMGSKAKGKPVLKIDAETNKVLNEYESMADAGRENYIHRETIRQCVSGRLKTAGGFKWKLDKAI